MSQYSVGFKAGGSTTIDTLTGNSGGAVGPTAGNINIVGTGAITVTGNPGTSTLTISDSGGGVTSITGDSGGALSGALTLTGGTTGLTFAGAGTTLTLGGTLAIADGGTNATSMSTSTGIVKYDGTRLVTSSTAKIDSSNRQTNTAQPAFQAYLGASDSNVTGDGTNYRLGSGNALTIVFDQGSNFTTSGTFTAPVTGKYFFFFGILASNVTATAATTFQPQITTTGNTFNLAYQSGATNAAAGGFLGVNGSIFCAMTAGDTCTFNLIGSGGTGKTMGIDGNQGLTFCGGYLVC